jgi:hypothetical protein
MFYIWSLILFIIEKLIITEMLGLQARDFLEESARCNPTWWHRCLERVLDAILRDDIGASSHLHVNMIVLIRIHQILSFHFFLGFYLRDFTVHSNGVSPPMSALYFILLFWIVLSCIIIIIIIIIIIFIHLTFRTHVLLTKLITSKLF